MTQRPEYFPTLPLAAVLTALAIMAWPAALREQRLQTKPFGYVPDAAGTAEFLRELDQPTFREAGAEAIREARGVDTFLYRAANAAHLSRYGSPWIVGKQGIGDCVSWGWCHAAYISQAIDWQTGRIESPPLMPATEAVYGGSRVEARGKSEGTGGYSDGSYGGAAAKWLRDWGVIYREPIGGHDLTTYSAERAKSWGNYGNGGKGDGGKLDAVAKTHPAAHVSLVTTWREAAASLESGYPIAVCSMAGFSSRRDEHGYAVPDGKSTTRWAHCMCLIAVRYAKNGSPRDGALCLNSWGPTWTGGPAWPDDMPQGSFWIDANTVEQMLSGRDSFAVGSVQGFGFRDLHHGNWITPPPLGLADGK